MPRSAIRQGNDGRRILVLIPHYLVRWQVRVLVVAAGAAEPAHGLSRPELLRALMRTPEQPNRPVHDSY